VALKCRGYSVGRRPLGGEDWRIMLRFILQGRLEMNGSVTGSCQNKRALTLLIKELVMVNKGKYFCYVKV
jgi:hypothetical protein